LSARIRSQWATGMSTRICSHCHIRNSIGTKTEPWGTPLITLIQCEHLPLMVTLICLSSKNYIIHCSMESWIPNIDNFCNNRPCGTVSNAFYRVTQLC